mgnify:CR=1 FL=1
MSRKKAARKELWGVGHYTIHSDIIQSVPRHSCESWNSEENWIPGQARNDRLLKTYVVMYKRLVTSKSLRMV